MNRLLEDLRIVEISAFVAAPLGGMTMAQLGADVIRIDPIGGGIDYARWPVTRDGASLYWAGLNKAKRSLALALDRPEGRDIASAVITAPGAGGGIVLTNLPPSRGLDFATLKAARDDLIMLRLIGNRDGSAAVDYTVNAASGFPLVTGQGGAPVNHVLPAWDIAAGLYLATALLAAERHRLRTGQGQEVVAALSDVMLATVGNLGHVGDVQLNGAARPAIGNDLYGSFGRDFATADGRRVMIIALTRRQWRAIGEATGLGERLAMIGPMMDVDLDTEAGRYEAREAILNRVGSTIFSVIDPNHFLQAAVNEVGKMMEVDRCDIMMLTPDGELRVTHEYRADLGGGLPPSFLEAIPITSRTPDSTWMSVSSACTRTISPRISTIT